MARWQPVSTTGRERRHPEDGVARSVAGARPVPLAGTILNARIVQRDPAGREAAGA